MLSLQLPILNLKIGAITSVLAGTVLVYNRQLFHVGYGKDIIEFIEGHESRNCRALGIKGAVFEATHMNCRPERSTSHGLFWKVL